MALKLPETKLEIIRSNLEAVGKEIDSSIVDQNTSLETKEDNRKQVWDENVLDKTKTSLKSDEKSRFLAISKIFVNEWLESVKKFKQAQEKRAKLLGDMPLTKKKEKPSFQLLSDLLGKKDKKKPLEPKKKKNSWLSNILLVIGLLGGGWAIFKGVIQKIPQQAWDALKDIGSGIVELGGDLLKGGWDMLKEGLGSLWDWIKGALHLEEAGEFITETWNTVSGWLDSIWESIKGAFKSVIGFITSAPGKIWDWVCETAKSLFHTVIDGILTAWNWIKDKVLAVWDWLMGELGKFWDGLKSAWKSVVDFFVGIWDWIKETFSFSNIWKSIKEWFNQKVQDFKNMFNLLISGNWKEFAKNLASKALNTLTFGLSDKVTNGITGWLNKIRGKDEEAKKKEKVKKEEKIKKDKQKKPEIKASVKQEIAKQKEIVLKDNVLETVKEICDRLNTFFSGKKDGFIDLSERLIKACSGGFKEVFDKLKNLKLENVYNVDNDIDYDDEYDQSDKSKKSITNDNRKVYNNDYRITYNNVDIPALTNAMNAIQRQSEIEVKLLESQNDYLVKMINNIDGMGNKLSFLDPSKMKSGGQNAIVPMMVNSGEEKSFKYRTFDLINAQSNYAKMFS